MRIAILSSLLPSGSKIGVGYQVHYLANALVKRGHHVTVHSQTGKSVDSLYEVEVLPPRKPLSTFRFSWDLRKMDFTKFDVLNAHGDDWFMWKCRRPRHVHTYHGSLLAETFHAKGVINKARMAALAACEYGSLLLADETVTVSENTRKYIPGIRHVIPCGVDTNAFRPGGSKSGFPSLLFVGTMHGRKRGAMLLELFRKQIRPAVPGAQIWCVCERPAGQPDEENVIWTGRIPEERLVELYRQAWVFCLPSTYEGFGVPYIEAMASGTAVVASPNVGAREVTGDGKWGVVCKDHVLAARIIELLSDAREREAMATAGLERSRDFSWDTVCARYEAVYAGGSTVEKTTPAETGTRSPHPILSPEGRGENRGASMVEGRAV